MPVTIMIIFKCSRGGETRRDLVDHHHFAAPDPDRRIVHRGLLFQQDAGGGTEAANSVQ